MMLALLREHGSLAPADDVQGREAILMDHAEVPLCFGKNLLARMRLKAKQDFEKCAGWSWPAGQMQHMSTRRDHPRDFRHAFA